MWDMTHTCRCSLDWMMNAAKFAASDDQVQTKVYFMEPPLFVEGSKTGMIHVCHVSHIYIYIYIYVCMFIYIERERERDVYIHIYTN